MDRGKKIGWKKGNEGAAISSMDEKYQMKIEWVENNHMVISIGHHDIRYSSINLRKFTVTFRKNSTCIFWFKK